MRTRLLLLLIPASLTAGAITTSTIGDATATVSRSGSGLTFFVQAFSNNSRAGDAQIDFSDSFRIIGPSAGTVQIQVSGGGSGLDGEGFASASVGPYNFFASPNLYVLQMATFDVPFATNTSIALSAHLAALAVDFAPNDPNEGSSDMEMHLSMFNFLVLDSTGQPTTDFSYVTASGDPLPFITPEPSSWLFMFIGLLYSGLKAYRAKTGA